MVQQSLETRQVQSLVMTQQLRQSIELLQLSTQELHAAIEAEMEKNPLLVEVEEEAEAQSRIIEDAAPLLDMEEGALWGNHDNVDMSSASSLSPLGNGGDGGDYSLLEQRMPQTLTLRESLIAQLQHCGLSLPEQKLAEALIDMLDKAGYAPPDYRERLHMMGGEKKQIAYVLQRVQECEPTGVGARDLQECLTLQLREKLQLDNVMQLLLANLPLIAQGNSKKLSRICGIEEAQLSHYIALIRACNPKPASGYDIGHSPTMIPDVVVRRTHAGIWEAELNQEILPKIALDSNYAKRLKAQPRMAEDGKIIQEHMSHAQWLLKSIQQRHQTLYAVATAIIAEQEDFFEYGVTYLRPMTLRDIAEKVGCHESTVSRITTQKYMATERGVFELKYFFTSHVHNANGGSDYSSRSVMHMIEQLVKQEVQGLVMSDEAIADALRKKGVEVARRTVVKYRTQLGIAPSNARKRIKNAI